MAPSIVENALICLGGRYADMLEIRTLVLAREKNAATFTDLTGSSKTLKGANNELRWKARANLKFRQGQYISN